MNWHQIKQYFPFVTAWLFIFLMAVGFTWKQQSPLQNQKILVALRAIGHELLLQHDDKHSLVNPVQNIKEQTYEISFQSTLSINPDSLVTLVQQKLKRSEFASEYLVEVRDCQTQVVQHSFEILNPFETSNIPCLDRKLPLGCYTIRVYFLDSNNSLLNPTAILATIGLVILGIALTFTFYQKKIETPKEKADNLHFIAIGSYQFDVINQTLQINDETIELSTKEFELISIFSKHLNQIVTREQLLKEVWEDKGVFVGRSLDVFISKLRKKLALDPTVNLVNIRGKGYKLEVVSNDC